MKPVTLSHDAKQDYIEIWRDGSSRYGEAAADHYSEALLQALVNQVNNPISTDRPATSLPGITTPMARHFSILAYKAHYLLYRELDQEVQIITIIRQGRDMNAMLDRIAKRLS